MEHVSELASHDDLYRIRHSLAHVLAQAVLEIRPDALLAFGPPVENGCYYDFLFTEPLTPEAFPDIENRMRRIIKEQQSFAGRDLTPEEAKSYLAEHGQSLKVEYCEELAARGERSIGFFTNGPFTDMCAGPHVAHTGELPLDAFKIDSIAGAYWRGDATRPQLSRLYCLAFGTKAELEDYLERRRLAQERDHRKLGKELDLFLISDTVGPGLPLWTPNGTAIRDALEALAREQEHKMGYVRVATPQIAKEQLYAISGHLAYYKESMFPGMELEGESTYYLKAMNCPHHHMIYNHMPRSYRELPMRFAEHGTVYRYEASGSLAGLLRVRSLCQNDAHIYCTNEQLKDELKATFKMCLDYYSLFRLEGVRVRYSTHDPDNMEGFADNPEMWRFSEAIVKEVLDELEVEYFVGKGEAAFYGPKIDFQARTLLGREESISTTQLDFAQPISFDLTYRGADGQEHRPFIVHRAPLGTHERFVAFLIEHFGGAFPTWMAPIQVRFIPINDSVAPYVQEFASLLRNNMVRVDIDDSDNSLNKRIREAVTHKIPNIAVVGNREAEAQTITLRRYCTQQQLTLTKDAFIARVDKLVAERIMDNFADVEVG